MADRVSGEFWLVAIVGLVLVGTLLLVHRVNALHQAIMAMYSGFTGLTLFLIYDMSHPFRRADDRSDGVRAGAGDHPGRHLNVLRSVRSCRNPGNAQRAFVRGCELLDPVFGAAGLGAIRIGAMTQQA